MMTKKQILEVIMTIEHAYNNPFTRNIDGNETKEQKLVKIIDTWYKLLKDHDFEKIKEHLNQHIMTSKYPPSIAELVNQPEKEIPSGPVVPSAEETQKMFEEREKEKANVASPEIREKHLAEIRRILNIPDDKENHHDRATS
jgi:Loader and inhibitor of phage G40P